MAARARQYASLTLMWNLIDPNSLHVRRAKADSALALATLLLKLNSKLSEVPEWASRSSNTLTK